MLKPAQYGESWVGWALYLQFHTYTQTPRVAYIPAQIIQNHILSNHILIFNKNNLRDNEKGSDESINFNSL